MTSRHFRLLLVLSVSLTVFALLTPRALASTAGSRPASSPFAVGVADMNAHRWAAAEQQFRLAIARKDHLERAYAGLGTAAAWLKDNKTAFFAFKKAVALDAHDLEAQQGLAQSAIAIRDFYDAYHAYGQLVRAAPKNPYFLYETAYSALYAADSHAAVSYATRYIKLAPYDWRGYHLRFLAYGNLLMHKQQVQDASKVVQLRPHDPSAYSDLGIALANDQQYKKSIKVLTTAIKMDPKNAVYYMNRGISESLNGQENLALQDLKVARSLTHDAKVRKQIDALIHYLQRRAHG
jgi:Flp pilus assembly protein TadD